MNNSNQRSFIGRLEERAKDFSFWIIYLAKLNLRISTKEQLEKLARSYTEQRLRVTENISCVTIYPGIENHELWRRAKGAYPFTEIEQHDPVYQKLVQRFPFVDESNPASFIASELKAKIYSRTMNEETYYAILNDTYEPLMEEQNKK